MANCKIFQIYYDNNQYEKLYQHSYFEHIYNPVPESFNFSDGYFLFENKIILDRVNTSIEEDYVGVWSHKHHEKIWGVSEDNTYNKRDGVDKFLKWFEGKIYRGGFDVMGFHRRMNKHHAKYMIIAAERFHKNFTVAINHIIKKGNLPIRTKAPFKYVTLMNYQVARTEIYLDYIEKVLRPAIEVMMNHKDSALQRYLFSDSGYSGDAKHNNTLQRISGTNHYTLHTFILERLFTLYLNTKRFKCINY